MTAIAPRSGRHAKGVNLVELTKLLRARRHKAPLPGIAPEVEALLDQRILVSSWYPLEELWALLDYTYRTLLEKKPEAALAMGVAGGRLMWSGPHKAFLGSATDPVHSLRHMATAWRNYFDFGSLGFDVVDEGTLRFTMHGYPDVPVYHGMMAAGWHLAAAHVTGWKNATAEVVARPWDGASEQVHVIRRG